MSVMMAENAGWPAGIELLNCLRSRHYQFITPTPQTHQRVVERRLQAAAQSPKPQTTDLRDTFGWNLLFQLNTVDSALLDCMVHSGAITDCDLATPDTPIRSTFRVSSLNDDLFLHSAFPTVQSDAVFFGPDTYRFARFIAQALRIPPVAASTDAPIRVLDMGCGTGAGGVAAVRVLGRHTLLTLNDINPQALRYAAANVAAAGITCQWLAGDAMKAVVADYDVIIANPPYLDDDQQRAYRHGGARMGRELSLRMAATALAHLAPGGKLLLYTGVAMVGGHDPFLAELMVLFDGFDGTWSYSEIDPDVFGEELERTVYADIDRIAAVGLFATRRAL